MGILLFGVSIFIYACQKDDDIKTVEKNSGINQTEFKISKIGKSKLDKNTKLRSQLKIFPKNLKNNKSDDSLNKTVVSSEYGFTINTDFANYLESTDSSYHSYTFYIQRDIETNSLENLLLSLKPDGTYKAVLITYNTTAQEKEDMLNGINIDLSGKVSASLINDEGLISDIFSKEYSECKGYTVKESCSCNTHTEETGYSDCDPGCYNYEREYYDCGDAGGGGSGGGGSPGDGSPGDGSPGDGTPEGGSTGDGQADNGGGGPSSSNGDDITTPTVPCRGDDCPEDFDEDLFSDCELLSQLSQSPDFIVKMNELKNGTAGNTEISYLGVTDSNGNTTFPSEYRDEGVANSNEVPLRVPTSPINVTLHNHATITQNPNNTPVIGNGSLPIHSPSDLYGIYDYYINGNIDNTDNYVNIVITPDQTLYAITISNESDFQANASKFLQAIYLAEIFYANSITQGNSNDLNETAFIENINKYKLGLKLYKGNFNQEQTHDPFTKWTQINIDNNGNKSPRDCN